MTKSLMCFASLVLFGMTAQANIRIPPGVHFPVDFDKAVAEAAEKGQGILLIQVNIFTSARTQVSLTQAMLRALRSEAVIVVIPTEGQEAFHNSNVPDRFTGLMRQRTMGTTPRTLLVDRELKQVVLSVKSEDLVKDERGTLRELVAKAKILAENGGLAAAGAPTEQPPAAAEEPMEEAAEVEPAELRFQNLSNTEGNTIRAAVLALEGDTVKLRREDGAEFDYPLGQLSPESQQAVRASLGEAAP